MLDSPQGPRRTTYWAPYYLPRNATLDQLLGLILIINDEFIIDVFFELLVHMKIIQHGCRPGAIRRNELLLGFKWEGICGASESEQCRVNLQRPGRG